MNMGSVSASDNNTQISLQNYDKSLNHETKNYLDCDINVNDSTTNKNLEETSVQFKKYNKLSPSNDNSSNLINSNNINQISNSEDEAQYIVIKEYNDYNSNCSLIQNIITEASPKSTLEFTGLLYEDLSLKINKPLNIISNVGTTITMTTNSPAFTILNGGSGTSISGFTIKGECSFVNANDVSHINIENNAISSETGIIFYNVFNSKIQNNEFLDFKIAMDIRKSGAITISKNNINTQKTGAIGINLEDDTDTVGIKILDNKIIGPSSKIDSIGINVGKNVYNILINGNHITNWHDGIYFKKSMNNVNINNNTINQNTEGVVLESGKLNGFSFTKNLVKDNEGYGILLDEDVEGYTSNPVVENNYFTKNLMDMRSAGDTSFEIGSNFVENLCHKFYMKMGFRVKFLKNGNNLIATVIGSKNNRVTDLPNFQGTLNIGRTNYNLQFKNGVAYLDLSGIGTGEGLGDSQFGVGTDSRSVNKWGYSVHGMSDSELEDYLKEYFGYSDNKEHEYKEEEQSNSTSNQGSGSKSSGSAGGDSYVSSSTSSSSSAGSSASLGSGSSSGSSGSSASTSTTDSQESPSDDGSSSGSSGSFNNVVAKEISVDEEKYKVAGVVGLITLILLVIGMYYREDVFEMMGNN